MTSYDAFVLVSPACSRATVRAAAAVMASAYGAHVAVKPSQHGFLMTGTNAIVWPLSPQDWSSG